MTDSEETLYVVFDRSKKFGDQPKKYTLDSRCKEIIQHVTKQCIREKIEMMQETDGDILSTKFGELVQAVELSNAQESVATDKFLNNVESMMSRLNDDVGRLQRIYDNIKRYLLKTQSS